MNYLTGFISESYQFWWLLVYIIQLQYSEVDSRIRKKRNYDNTVVWRERALQIYRQGSGCGSQFIGTLNEAAISALQSTIHL